MDMAPQSLDCGNSEYSPSSPAFTNSCLATDGKSNKGQHDHSTHKLAVKRATNRRNSARYRKRVKNQIATLIDKVESYKVQNARLEQKTEDLTMTNQELESKIQDLKAQLASFGPHPASLNQGNGVPIVNQPTEGEQVNQPRDIAAQEAHLLACLSVLSGEGAAALRASLRASTVPGTVPTPGHHEFDHFTVNTALSLIRQQRQQRQVAAANSLPRIGGFPSTRGALQLPRSSSSSKGLLKWQG